MSKITRIALENFTCLSSIALDLSPGLNVIIGGNGTGKTHLLKILYAACAITVGEEKDKSFGLKLRNVFRPWEDRVGRLARRQGKSTNTRITITREGNETLEARFSNHSKGAEDIKSTGEPEWKTKAMESAYIPVKEMLAHAPGFLATVAMRELAFEDTYVDLIKRAYLPKFRGAPGPDRARLLKALENAIDGKVVVEGEHFFLSNDQGTLEFSLLAEGMRKLALVWLLIQNGTLGGGSILFWDEPEANINPRLMGDLVEVLLELSRMGVQVVFSTHNYVVLKEIDLRMKKTDEVRFISLFRDASQEVQAHVTDDYAQIDHNAISDTFADLYRRDMERALGRGA
jgi:ABC-type transporter Mla maintaining outer membrane lipid asymmetry ATPase subunit MlaF